MELIQEVIVRNFNQQIAIHKSNQEDTVDNLYRINLSTFIDDLSSDFVKYYIASNLETGVEYFAIIFDSSFIVDFTVLSTLKNSNFEFLNKLITYNIVKISTTKSYHLVVIVEKYNFQNNLENHVAIYGTLGVDDIVNNIISPLNTLLEQLEKSNIMCANINPKNIIVLGNAQFMLREFITTYNHYNQEYYYLAPEIAECHPAGRKNDMMSSNIYALGMTVFYVITGVNLKLKYVDEYSFNLDRFQNGMFKIISNFIKLNEHLKLFFKGVLHEQINLRWRTLDIKNWLSYKVDKILNLDTFSNKNLNTISFSGDNYDTIKGLSYALFNNWNSAISLVHEEKFIKWLQKQSFNNNITEILRNLLDVEYYKHDNNIVGDKKSWHLTKILSTIDPYGGIRQDTIGFTASSINTILHYLYSRNNKHLLEIVIKAIYNKYWSFINNVSVVHIPNSIGVELNNIADFYNNSLAVFGIERIVYTLNPTMICLSSLVIKDYVCNLADLLKALNEYAIVNPDKISIDRHIIAFISAKIAIKKDTDIQILDSFPNFRNHPLIQGIVILSIAQQFEQEVNINALCRVLIKQLIELLKVNLHNIEMKQKVLSELTDYAEEGDLSKVVKRLQQSQDFIDDYNNYYKACKHVQRLEQDISKLMLEDLYSKNAIFLGQKLSVLISYVLCFIVTLMLIF